MPTLNWHKREEAVRAATRAPYRLLEPVAELSCGDADSENLLIQGDNLDAIKAQLPYYAGRVRCIAIDPPCNTQSAFKAMGAQPRWDVRAANGHRHVLPRFLRRA
jgi:adenine-specific DNA-methyltransferase